MIHVNGKENMKKFKIELKGIKWDTDGQRVKLPKDLVVEIDARDRDEAEQFAVDAASDKTGWCINSVEDIVFLDD